MSVLKEIFVAVAGVYALLFACDALFGIDEGRFDEAYYSRDFYAPRSKEFRFASNTTPAARVRDAFAQFTPGEAKSGEAKSGEAKSGKRYSSLTTVIR